MKTTISILLSLVLFSPQLFSQEVAYYKSIRISYLNTQGNRDTINLSDVITGKDTLTAFYNQRSEVIDHSYFKGNVVLLDFWFLRCRPCLAELPGIDRINKRIKSSKFRVITFANDPILEIQDKLLSKIDWDFSIIPEVYLVENKIYPYKVLINKKGQIVHEDYGGNVLEGSAVRLFDEYSEIIQRTLRY